MIALNLYEQIAKREKIKFDLYDRGILHFYFNKKQTEHALDVNKLYKQAGLKRIRITHDELYTLEPSLIGKNLIVFFLLSQINQEIYIVFVTI